MTQGRREFLKSIGLSSAALMLANSPGCTGKSPATRLPNIVLIFTDDQGYADLGTYGAKGFRTPNLDRLAREGMRFSDFYVSQAVCSASRASLLTGCYAERVGVQGALMPWATSGLNPGEETIARMLKRRGYATAIFGKWHLGHQPRYLPLQQGFDEYLGLPYSNDMWPVDYSGKPLTWNSETKNAFKALYPPLPLIDGNRTVEEIHTLAQQSTLTTRYTERAVQFIEKNRDRPFFLYLPHTMVHVPLAVSARFKGKSEQGMYGDVMMEIDWSAGRIMSALKAHGLADNTLVIYTSDNGPWLNFGNHGGCARPLREGKGTAWEGGVRVPCIMRWPGRIPAGTTCEKIAATIDILPTLAAITGSPLPRQPIDGVNILPLLEGRRGADPRHEYFYYYYGQLRAVRQGKWKLVLPHRSRSYRGVPPGKDGFPGPTKQVNAHLALYDLKKDVEETTDLSGSHPMVVQRLQKLAEQARIQLGDTLTHRKGKGVRPYVGRDDSDRPAVQHLAVGRHITLQTQPSRRYPGSGPDTLIDGKRGGLDYTSRRWQGFQGIDCKAAIDLGREMRVSEVTCSFLENQISWIFLPKKLKITFSKEKKAVAFFQEFTTSPKFRPKPRIKELTARFKKSKIRYIEIEAVNVGQCPPWHPGAGGKAWLLIDEIIVK